VVLAAVILSLKQLVTKTEICHFHLTLVINPTSIYTLAEHYNASSRSPVKTARSEEENKISTQTFTTFFVATATAVIMEQFSLMLLTIRHPGLPFNGPHPRNPCNYMDYYSFIGPREMEG